jgi:hypothetical protein
MPDASHAPLRELLKNKGESSPPRSFLASGSLQRSLRTSRTWVFTLSVLTLVWLALMLGLTLFNTVYRAPEVVSQSPMLVTRLMLLLAFFLLLTPIPVFMLLYGLRIQAFLSWGRSEQLLQLIAAQKWMWMILGLYSVMLILLNVLSVGAIIALVFHL